MSKSTNQTPVTTDLPTVESYLAADRSGRAKIRAALEATMKSAIASGDLPGAMAANTRLDECKSAAGATPAATPVDWAQVTADRIATLRAAAAMLEAGDATIEGVPDDYDWSTTDDGSALDLPEGTPDDDKARALASARVTRSGPTHNVGEAIRAAFASHPDGHFLTVAEIGRHWIANGGPANNSGRIAARLFADECTVSGIVPVASTATAPRGARKVGDWS